MPFPIGSSWKEELILQPGGRDEVEKYPCSYQGPVTAGGPGLGSGTLKVGSASPGILREPYYPYSAKVHGPSGKAEDLGTGHRSQPDMALMGILGGHCITSSLQSLVLLEAGMR